MENLDTSIYEAINALARETPSLHPVLAAYALWAGPVLLALLLVWAWWRARRRPDAPRAVATTALTGAAAVVALLVNQRLVSPAIARPRPCRTLPHVQVLLTCSRDYSMPSDHTVLAGAFAFGLFLLGRRYGTLALALALLLAFGRVYVGVHYPADTVAGLLLGAGVAAAVVAGIRRPATTAAQRLAATRLHPLITTEAPTHLLSTGPRRAQRR